MDVIIVNDFAELNKRYRSNFISHSMSNFNRTLSVGWFDRWWAFLRILFLCHVCGFIFFSSNLRSNLLSLVLLNRGLVVLNGMGRYRSNFVFRCFLIFVIKYRTQNKTILVQNYADFRWLRLKSKRSNVLWCPGSGGVVRSHSVDDRFLVVSRPDKFRLQYRHIATFISVIQSPISIVGVSSDYGNLLEPSSVDICFCGYLPQEDIFKFGSRLFHPPGYGEGIPHVVVDAIVSGLEVFITRRQFVQFGFYKLPIHYSCFGSYVVCSTRKDVKSGLESEVIVLTYSDLIAKFSTGVSK